ncbi:hypothetical protein [Candidatus Halobonum tyrrellensis]|uniref:hypothetical protein n=1 Tax=Candidatus Halobonum tyrrellensis TaxID=1431545 RepID=UPI001376A030|nr:hypothetical protein [Candidatus Halobonum tyrrellensis]
MAIASSAVDGGSLVRARRDSETFLYLVEIPFEQKRLDLITGGRLFDIVFSKDPDCGLPRKALAVTPDVRFEVFEDSALSRTQGCPRVRH